MKAGDGKPSLSTHHFLESGILSDSQAACNHRGKGFQELKCYRSMVLLPAQF